MVEQLQIKQTVIVCSFYLLRITFSIQMWYYCTWMVSTWSSSHNTTKLVNYYITYYAYIMLHQRISLWPSHRHYGSSVLYLIMVQKVGSIYGPKVPPILTDVKPMFLPSVAQTIAPFDSAQKNTLVRLLCPLISFVIKQQTWVKICCCQNFREFW